MFRISPNLIYWRHIPELYRFEGVECTNCGDIFFPKRYFCPKCGFNSEIKPRTLRGSGTIVTYTRVCAGVPEFFEDQTPYILAIVKLDEGPKVISQIVDCDYGEIQIGLRVEAVVRKLFEDGESGIVFYGYKFKPLQK